MRVRNATDEKHTEALGEKKGAYKVPQTRTRPNKLPRAVGGPNPEDPGAVREWLEGTHRPWAIDLFSGAGGLSLGLEHAGFTVVSAADSDPHAVETHLANFEGPAACEDLSDPQPFLRRLERYGVRDVDLVAGGPPCQPFSTAGSSKIRSLVQSGARDRHDRRGDLWQSFLQIIDAVRPRAVLFENVPDFARVRDGELLALLMSELTERGYHVDAEVLEARRFGVPQHRQRLFLVATRTGHHLDWPRPARGRQNATVRMAIGDLPDVGPGQRQYRMAYEGSPTSWLGKLLRKRLAKQDTGCVTDHVTRFVRPDDAKIFALMKEGESYKDVPEELRRYRSDIFKDKFKRLEWDSVGRTITAHIAKDGYWYIHPTADRTLSIREAARLQTFPDGFQFAGHPSHRFTQIGNAVPPLLAESVGRAIAEQIADPAVPDAVGDKQPTIRDALVGWHRVSGRSFLWRRQRDPWKILLAEVCLHRTRAAQVSTMYAALIDAAPTPGDLLERHAEVEQLMNGLGLRWRTAELVKLAQTLIERHDGRVPDDWDVLRALPGVGDYIAAAVRCFAFGHPSVLVDANTRRFAQRMQGAKDLGAWQVRLALHRYSLPDGPNAEWNYALLDLGGLICRPINPKCGTCPVGGFCKTGLKSAPDKIERNGADEVELTHRIQTLQPGMAMAAYPQDGENPSRLASRVRMLGDRNGIPLYVDVLDGRVRFAHASDIQ